MPMRKYDFTKVPTDEELVELLLDIELSNLENDIEMKQMKAEILELLFIEYPWMKENYYPN